MLRQLRRRNEFIGLMTVLSFWLIDIKDSIPLVCDLHPVTTIRCVRLPCLTAAMARLSGATGPLLCSSDSPSPALSRAMTKNDGIIIGLALQVLEAAVAHCGHERIDTVNVRLALRCLLPHCPEKWPLTTFWDGASGDKAIGRGASCTAGLNGIRLQLKSSGAI